MDSVFFSRSRTKLYCGLRSLVWEHVRFAPVVIHLFSIVGDGMLSSAIQAASQPPSPWLRSLDGSLVWLVWPMKPTAPRDVEREHWEERKVFFCVCVGGRKNRVKIKSPLSAVLPFLPSLTGRSVPDPPYFHEGNRISRRILMSYQSPLPRTEGYWFATAPLI